MIRNLVLLSKRNRIASQIANELPRHAYRTRITFDREGNAPKLRHRTRHKCHQRMDGGYGRSLLTQHLKDVARKNATGMKGNSPFPVLTGELNRGFRDLRIGHAKPDQISLNGRGTGRPSPRSQLPCQLLGNGQRTPVIARDHFPDRAPGIPQSCRQRRPEAPSSHYRNRWPLHRREHSRGSAQKATCLQASNPAPLYCLYAKINIVQESPSVVIARILSRPGVLGHN